MSAAYEDLLLAVEFLYTDFLRVPAEKANAMLPLADTCALCLLVMSYCMWMFVRVCVCVFVFVCVSGLTGPCRLELPKLSALLKKSAVNDNTPLADAGDELITHMNELLEYGRYGDVTFSFPRKGQKLKAHRAVLAAR